MFEGLFQPMHLLLLLGIALLIFGPKRLPELGKGLGTSIRDFKDAMTGQKPEDKASSQLEAPKASVAAQPASAPAAAQPATTAPTASQPNTAQSAPPQAQAQTPGNGGGQP
jgi:sec-independent protein translocase protein TatA